MGLSPTMVGMRDDFTSAAVESPAKRRRWIPWVAGGGAFLLTLIVGGAVVADWAWRNAQMTELLDRVQASEDAMGQLQDAVTEVIEEHRTGEDPTKLDSQLRELAAEAETNIADAGAEVAALPIAIWHADIDRARDVYLLHNQAWVEYMARSSQDAQEFFAPQPLVNQTFIDALPVFELAVPLPDPSGLMERVREMFSMPAPEDQV